MTTPKQYAELEEFYQSIFGKLDNTKDYFDPVKQNHTRMRRALSWLRRSEQTAADDKDARFVFLWIAFNAAYGDDLLYKRSIKLEAGSIGEPEHKRFMDFLSKIVKTDRDAVYKIIWTRFSNEYQQLVNNRFLFRGFWEAEHDDRIRDKWQRNFKVEKQKAFHALGSPHNTLRLLQTVLDRLYLLRNQMVHGGATYGSKFNRTSVRNGTMILVHLVPAILHIMLQEMQKEPAGAWGVPPWPRYLDIPDDISKVPPQGGEPDG